MGQEMKRTRRTKEQMAAANDPVAFKNVMVLVGNVWAMDCKFYQFDVVRLDAEEAGFLIERKQVKATNDDVTVDVDRDVRPFQRIEL